MTLYQNCIGIDIGKFTFVANLHGKKDTHEYENTPQGIGQFLRDFKRELPQSLVVLETTGGYEMQVLLTLADQKIPVHRANTRFVKNFIRSLGQGAKTDALDAKALALYGFEREDRLELFTPPAQNQLDLFALTQRRKELKQMRVAEKNRLKGPRAQAIKESCEKMIEILTSEIETLSTKIQELIQEDATLLARKEELMTIPGIGDITAQELLSLLPELGTLSRQQIASLAGLAPRANESGKFKGYRRTGPGRQGIKPTLFMAAMAARTSNSTLKSFYLSLLERGKNKMVSIAHTDVRVS